MRLAIAVLSMNAVLDVPHVCSPYDYGVPNPTHCSELIEGTTKAGGFPGIANLDTLDHAFLLESTASERKFTPSQWDKRFLLPYGFASRPSRKYTYNFACLY